MKNKKPKHPKSLPASSRLDVKFDFTLKNNSKPIVVRKNQLKKQKENFNLTTRDEMMTKKLIDKTKNLIKTSFNRLNSN